MPQCLFSGKFKELLNSVLAYAYCSMHIDYNSVFGGQLSANYKNFSIYNLPGVHVHYLGSILWCIINAWCDIIYCLILVLPFSAAWEKGATQRSSERMGYKESQTVIGYCALYWRTFQHKNIARKYSASVFCSTATIIIRYWLSRVLCSSSYYLWEVCRQTKS